MDQKFGITNLKKLVGFGCAITKQVETSAADGYQWHDLFAFADEAMRIPDVVKAWPEVKNEIAEMSEEERAELGQFITDNFDIADDEKEGLLEDSIKWSLLTISMVQRWKRSEKTDA